MDYTLHFKAGENQEMYFFNKFDSTLNKGKEKEQNQPFYINKGNGVTAKEAFNLMEGRAVYKQLYNKEGEGYNAWLQLDNQNQTTNGNKEIKRFNENYGFDLESVLKDKGIKELSRTVRYICPHRQDAAAIPTAHSLPFPLCVQPQYHRLQKRGPAFAFKII